MFSVCPGCGAFRPDRLIEHGDSVAVCPECGQRQPFVKKPLLVVGGASGSGKSTLCQALLGRVPGAVLLDSDVLWRPEFNTPENGFAEFFETWLRLAVALNQSCGPLVLFGAGFAVPGNLETRVYRRYLGPIHYLALECRAEVLQTRLRARPAWRDSAGEAFVAQQLAFNQWLRESGPHSAADYTVIDTTALSVEQTRERLAGWLEMRL